MPSPPHSKKRESRENPTPFADLLRAARAGGDQARDRAYREISPFLASCAWGAMSTTVKDREEIADLVQQAWLKILAALPGFEVRTPGECAAWLKKIVENVVRDRRAYYRAGLRDAHLEKPDQFDLFAEQGDTDAAHHKTLPGTGISLSHQVAKKVKAERLLQKVSRLPKDQREVVRFRSEGLSWKEVAARLGRTPAACQMLFTRARQRLVR